MAIKNQNVSYLCDGTSALAPSYPTFTLIEGGKSQAANTVAPEPFKSYALSYRAVVVVVLLALCAFGFCALRDFQITAGVTGALDSAETTIVTVRDGDTLWGLACEHAVSGVSTKDLVKWIENENNLTSAHIISGQELTVPVSGE